MPCRVFWFWGVLLVVAPLLGGIQVRGQDDAKAEAAVELDASVLRFVDAFLASGGDLAEHEDKIWRSCLAGHGTIDPLLTELEARVDSDKTAETQRLPLIRLTAALLR